MIRLQMTGWKRILSVVVFCPPCLALSDPILQETDIPQPAPFSPLLSNSVSGMNHAFCAKWNPDFAFRGAQCCGGVSWKYRRRGIRCSPQRSKNSFCDEMTLEQREYWSKVSGGQIEDILGHLESEFGKYGDQAMCKPTNGFLAWGRPLLESSMSRIRIRRPGRCVNFGTNRMVALLEWLGREVGRRYPQPEFQQVRLLVGDMSAPRGGCLAGHSGRRGHASHMNGKDVDLGFLWVKTNQPSPKFFTRQFSAKENWWLMKRLFSNPYVCVSKVLLDWRHIRKLKKEARGDPMWSRLRPFIRHVRRHRNHYHIRIGDGPGAPGCKS